MGCLSDGVLSCAACVDQQARHRQHDHCHADVGQHPNRSRTKVVLAVVCARNTCYARTQCNQYRELGRLCCNAGELSGPADRFRWWRAVAFVSLEVP